MTLNEVLPKIMSGEKARRKNWWVGYWIEYDKRTFTIYEKVFFKGNIQVTHKDNIKDRIFCVADVMSDDWEIVEDIVDEWTNKHLKDVENETEKTD